MPGRLHLLNNTKTGYTIVEVLIVMAITGALFISVIALFSGQQHRTQFSQAINDIDGQIRDTIGNVGSGFYAKTVDFGCQATGNAQPAITAPTGQQQGEHNDCIFIGRALQFAVDNDQTRFNFYNIIGQRQKGGQEVTTLPDAYPEALGPNGPADTTQRSNLLYGLTAVRMYFKHSTINAGNPVRINTVAFISTLPGYSSGNLNPGSTSVQLMPVYVQSAPLPDIQHSGPGNNEIQGALNINKDNLGVIPDGGVTICFASGGTDQYGVITIGSNGRQLTTKVNIENTSTATALGGDCDPNY